jgi:periplasmic protein CpxP/Spy
MFLRRLSYGVIALVALGGIVTLPKHLMERIALASKGPVATATSSFMSQVAEPPMADPPATGSQPSAALPASVQTTLAQSLQSSDLLHPPQAKVLAQATGQPQKGEPRGPKWLQDLDLTPTQIQAIQGIRDRTQVKLRKQRESLKQARQSLRTLMAGDRASEADLRQQHQQVQLAKQALAATQFENLLAIRTVLTPEQRQRLSDRMQQTKEPRRERGGIR